MYEFLIKQENGLYKLKSCAELEFIEQYYSFLESQSNADALLGKYLPFEYKNNTVTFENEASLTNTGTYIAYAQINATNDSIMCSVASTVADAKNNLADAIAIYGVKITYMLWVTTTIAFQPLPGVTPADLALKQDKILETPIVIKGQTYTTVEETLAAIAEEINNGGGGTGGLLGSGTLVID